MIGEGNGAIFKAKFLRRVTPFAQARFRNAVSPAIAAFHQTYSTFRISRPFASVALAEFGEDAGRVPRLRPQLCELGRFRKRARRRSANVFNAVSDAFECDVTESKMVWQLSFEGATSPRRPRPGLSSCSPRSILDAFPCAFGGKVCRLLPWALTDAPAVASPPRLSSGIARIVARLRQALSSHSHAPLASRPVSALIFRTHGCIRAAIRGIVQSAGLGLGGSLCDEYSQSLR